MPTDAEIAEYRRLRPMLLEMLAGWETMREEFATLKSSSGCPVARQILTRR